MSTSYYLYNLPYAADYHNVILNHSIYLRCIFPIKEFLNLRLELGAYILVYCERAGILRTQKLSS